MQGHPPGGAIFKAAGAAELQKACDKLAPIETGDAVITPGFGLAAGYVIHTAGPAYRGGGSGEEAQLRTCSVNSLKRAVENGCESVAFPLIATGRHGYPKKEALRVARTAIEEFLHGLEGHGPATRCRQIKNLTSSCSFIFCGENMTSLRSTPRSTNMTRRR